MADWKNDIEKYRRGELTPQEGHDLEKKALQDPFLADAIEGAESISADDFSDDIAELKSSIAFQSEERSVVSYERMAAAPSSSMRVAVEKEFALGPPKKVKKWIWPLRAAASILIICFTFLVANRLIPKQGKENLAIKKEKAKPAAIDTLSIAQNKVNSNIAKSTEEKPQQLNPAKPAIAFKHKSKNAVIKKDDNKGVILSDAVDNTKATEVTADVELKKAESIAASEQPTPVVKMEAPREAAEAELKKKSAGSTSVRLIKGQVISEEDGTPIPGVNVIVNGTKIGAVTDMDGNYQLPEVGTDQKLTFSFIGYVSQEVPVANQKDINVKLGLDVSQLSEIVVVGYGSQKNTDEEPVIVSASPAGGLRAFNKYLDDSMRYPIEALELNIKGKVVVQFTVGTDGSLNDFIVKKSIGHGCDEEVIRLVKEGPAWSPTTEDNVAVESNVLVKLRFDPAKAKK
jgi:TonB family protein